MGDQNFQYNRKFSLIVQDATVNGLDLSGLRVKFAVKSSDTQTPNTADIRVYNIQPETAVRIREEFKTVTLSAGYNSNSGVIFQGNIQQVILGRESPVLSYMDIVAGDGDKAYNFAVVNESLAKGSKLTDNLKVAADSMSEKGVTQGHIDELPSSELPRGQTMFGNARDVLRDIAISSKSTWSIQKEKITFVARKSYLPGQIINITSTSGLISFPQQTNDGVNVKCLLNPNLQPSRRIKLENDSILQQKLNLDQIAAARGDTKAINNIKPRNLSADGVYYVLVLEHIGDTWGNDWYSNMVCLTTDTTANPRNSVQVPASG
jgi:hypothetical protein